MKLKKVMLLAATLLLSACGDSITDIVNTKFPPISADEQRKIVLQEAAAMLNALDGPNLAFGAALVEVQKALLTKELTDQGVKSIALSSDRQLMKAEISFNRTFSDDGAGDLVKSLRPRVVGTATVLAGLESSYSETSEKDAQLVIKVRPVFDTIRVERIEVADRYDVTALGGALVAILERFADNVSGALTNLEAMKVKVPTAFAETKDFSQVIKVEGGSFDGNVKVTAQPVGVPVKLQGVAFVIADGKILGVAQVDPVSGREPGKRIPVAPTEEAMAEAFRSVVRDVFAVDPYPDKVWATVRKDLIAYAINTVVGQAKLCAQSTGSIARQEFSEQVKFPDESTVDCSPTRECSPTRQCNFERSHDTRNCHACLLKLPDTWWGRGSCVKEGNDPLCEAAKAAQNVAYDADYSAKKFDCERLKSTEKATCEFEKTGEKALCETGKELLKRLARTGNFANIDGSFQGTANLSMCIGNFGLSSDLSRVAAKVDLGGNAEGDLHLKFVPLDIVGHLTCQAPWTEDQKVRAAVMGTTLPIEAGIKLASDGDKGPRYEFAINPVTLGLRMDPGPTEFILKSVNMTLACQGANLLKPLIIPATAFIPELRGEFDHEIEATTTSLALKLPEVEIGGKKVAFSLGETAQALVLRGSFH